jgi:nitroreductase
VDLFEAILARRSVRRYEKRRLDPNDRATVKSITASVRPLSQRRKFSVLYHDVSSGEDLVRALGAYGRIVTPPHYVVPYLVSEDEGRARVLALTELGFCVEQIAVRLRQAGIASCYVGCLPREDEARALFRLPDCARIGATLVYGYPARGRGDRVVNDTVRWAVGATRKLPPERLFYEGSFDRPSTPPTGLASLIEAARAAPSADNAQPWRFLWFEDRLYLYILKHSWRYGLGGSQNYRWYDGGICMANVSLAMEALGLGGSWETLDGLDGPAPDCPDQLEPLAVLRLVQ